MRQILLGGLLIFLTGCFLGKPSATAPATAQQNSRDAVTPGAFRESAPEYWNLIHTDIDISFNIPEKTADATAVISMHPHYFATDSVVLDAKNMQIKEVTSAALGALSYRYDTSALYIHLPRIFGRTDTLRLTIRYKAMPYAYTPKGGAAISEDRGLYFVNADGAEPYQPMQIWTQGETEANSHWFPTFDKPNFRSTFQITMHVPDTLVTLSNGRQVSSVSEPDGRKAVTWRQDIPIPPYLVMMAVGSFYKTVASSSGTTPVTYYVPKRYGRYAAKIFAHTPEMIDYFSTILKVPYPWNKYSQVIVYDYVSGAMENVSASLFGAFNLKDDRMLADAPNDYIIAHELFHQWFGDYVTCESWSQITLNESFADFSEKLWAAHKYGPDQAARQLIRSLNQYLTQARKSDPPLVRFYYQQDLDVFDRVSYSKGGLILNYLRHLVGDSAFFDALHVYLTDHALQSAEATQLRLSFEKVTGQDWHWFFNQWYYRGGHPELTFSYRYEDGKVITTVRQIQDGPLYRLPIKVAVLQKGTVSEVNWTIDQQEQSFIYDFEGSERPVIIPDVAHWIPGVLYDHKDAAQWIEQLKYAPTLFGKYDALMAVARNEIKGDSAAKLLAIALDDKQPFIRATAITLLDLDQSKYRDDRIKKLGWMAQSDPDNKVKTAALSRLADLRVTDFLSTYQQALTDSSYLVATAALHALDKVKPSEALDAARKLQTSNYRSALWMTEAGKIIGREGRPEDYDFFKQTMLHFFERDRAQMLQAFVVYLNHLSDEQLYRQGVAAITRMAAREASSQGQLILSSGLHDLYQYADLHAKMEKEKQKKQAWVSRRELSRAAWEKYKSSVTDPAIISAIEAIEKPADH